jgi:hypothetical protein
MPVLSVAWAFLSKLPWKYIGIALAAVALLATLYKAPWAESRGRAAVVAKYQPVLARAADRVNRALIVLTSADDTMRLQSASIRSQAEAQTAALAKADRLLAEADKRDVSRQAQIKRLSAVAATPISGPPCDLPDEVKGDWK